LDYPKSSPQRPNLLKSIPNIFFHMAALSVMFRRLTCTNFTNVTHPPSHSSHSPPSLSNIWYKKLTLFFPNQNPHPCKTLKVQIKGLSMYLWKPTRIFIYTKLLNIHWIALYIPSATIVFRLRTLL
jgi:hypothetical protein